MVEKKFYKPLQSLVNVILTGDEKSPQGEEPIILGEEFLNSVSNPKDDSFNLYFLDRIEKFLANRGKNDRVDMVKVFYDNDDLLSGAYILTNISNKDHRIEDEDFAEKFNKIMLEFVIGGDIHIALCVTLYFYIENLARINSKNRRISIAMYNKALMQNSRKRDVNSVFSY